MAAYSPFINTQHRFVVLRSKKTTFSKKHFKNHGNWKETFSFKLPAHKRVCSPFSSQVLLPLRRRRKNRSEYKETMSIEAHSSCQVALASLRAEKHTRKSSEKDRRSAWFPSPLPLGAAHPSLQHPRPDVVAFPSLAWLRAFSGVLAAGLASPLQASPPCSPAPAMLLALADRREMGATRQHGARTFFYEWGK